MEEMITKEMQKWHIPGCQITVLQKGKTIYDKSFGIRNLETGAAVDNNTSFCIASCTKSFTVMIAAMLAEEGLLDFDTPIVKYLPGFALKDAYAGNNLCLRDIFSHRSGLAGHDFTWPDYEISDREYVEKIKYLDPVVPFRSYPKYNNVMYILAGYIEEQVSGKSWSELVQTKILKPLGMTHTYVSLEETPEDATLAEGYKYCGEDYLHLTSIAPKARASGSIVSTTEDLAKWLLFHQQKGKWNGVQLVSEKLMEDMHHPLVVFEDREYDFEITSMPICYGMGWFVREYRGMQIQYHHGGTLGFCSLQAYLPEQEICIAILTNVHGIGGIFEDALMSNIIDKLCGFKETDWLEKYYSVWSGTNHEIDLVPEDWKVSEEVKKACLQEYTGIYENPGYAKVSVFEQEEKLYFRFKMFTVEMQYVSEDSYIVENLIADTEFYRLPVRFIREGGVITGLSVPLERELLPLRFAKRG